ncbi:MAG: class I SAM-dependent methyltransferase [Rubellimicrobium sp.]|nr:class I SAM-dependent methyltransferase [Rubellimicrobium sp.]
MWERLLETFLKTFTKKGQINIDLPSGGRIVAGSGEPVVSVRITDPALIRRLCLNPELAVGEGYVDGRILIENDDLYGFLTFVTENTGQAPELPLWQAPLAVLRRWTRGLDQWNPVARSKSNVAHHYDLSGKLYDLFLDADKQYSCAYWPEGVTTLDEAQAAKKAHIARKLLIEPGMRILDIGCGWGGMALTLARDYGARVLGVTLSEEQFKIATQRARDAGLEDRVEFQLIDYRKVTGPFDRIVSVGMFEHVGVPQYRTFFGKVHDLLTEDGIALIHTIGRAAPPTYTSPWIEKYIFPGGYTPALSETMHAVEKEALVETDIEVWRLHYAYTLHQWHARFMARIDEAKALYDERFTRMWRFYLIASELAFVQGHQVVFHLQLARRKDAVPITRDYLYRDGPQPVAQAAE